MPRLHHRNRMLAAMEYAVDELGRSGSNMSIGDAISAWLRFSSLSAPRPGRKIDLFLVDGIGRKKESPEDTIARFPVVIELLRNRTIDDIWYDCDPDGRDRWYVTTEGEAVVLRMALESRFGS